MIAAAPMITMTALGDGLSAEMAAFDTTQLQDARVKLVDSASVTWTLNSSAGTISAAAAGGPGGGLTYPQILSITALGM